MSEPHFYAQIDDGSVFASLRDRPVKSTEQQSYLANGPEIGKKTPEFSPDLGRLLFQAGLAGE